MPIEQEFYTPIYRILLSRLDEDTKVNKVAEWLFNNHRKIKMSTLRASFRKAGREDLIDDFIENLDVHPGDSVKSRSTGRVGVVTEIKSDGETLCVKWDTGGTQQLAKEQIIIMHTKKEHDFNKEDFSNAKTPLPGYDRINKEDRDMKTLRPVTLSNLSDN